MLMEMVDLEKSGGAPNRRRRLFLAYPDSR